MTILHDVRLAAKIHSAGGLSWAEMSRRAGIATPTGLQFVQGRHNLSVETLERFANGLGLEIVVQPVISGGKRKGRRIK